MVSHYRLIHRPPPGTPSPSASLSTDKRATATRPTSPKNSHPKRQKSRRLASSSNIPTSGKSTRIRVPGSNKTEFERKMALETDEFVKFYWEQDVQCRGCDQVIKLDRRRGAKYYPRFWNNHRDRCSKVQELRRRNEVPTSCSPSP
ncbi:hypothetical protein BDZ97DRAFT_1788849 [Flammula alnicola]|nr:hypothetical protein BDZ97DRAFT_1788849 [Flammula alnicola]